MIISVHTIIQNFTSFEGAMHKTKNLVVTQQGSFAQLFPRKKYVHFFHLKHAVSEAKKCIFGGSNQQK
jgi:hypothetical protein